MKNISSRFEYWYSKICDPIIKDYALKNPILFEGKPFSWEVSYELFSFNLFRENIFSINELIEKSRNRYALLDVLWPGPFPTAQEIEDFYQASYDVLPWGHGIWMADHNNVERRSRWLRRVDMLLRLKELGVTTVMDYGGGGGHTALLALAAGFDGVGYHEYFEWHAYVRWRLQKVFPASWQKMHFSSPKGKKPDQSYDAVICADVPEHVYDPIELLQQLTRCIKTGGYLAWISVFGEGISCHLHPQYKGKESLLLRSFGFDLVAPLMAEAGSFSGIFQYTPVPRRCHTSYQNSPVTSNSKRKEEMAFSEQGLNECPFEGKSQVYLASADNMKQTLANLQILKKQNFSNIYRYISVIGGLSGLNYIATLQPKQVLFFDINSQAIPYAKFFLELIGCCKTPKDFISRIFSRSVDEFEREIGTTLNYQTQEFFLKKRIDVDLLQDTLSKLSHEGQRVYNEYISPHLYNPVLSGRCNCRRLLPCWPISDTVPVGAGEKVWVGEDGQRIPNTNTFFYGFGWLETEAAYVGLRSALQHAQISFKVLDLLSVPCQTWMVSGRKNVLHVSNINDWFPDKWGAFYTHLLHASQSSMTDISLITSHNGIYYINSDAHCKAYEAILPYVSGKVVEVVHKPGWGFHEFSPESYIVEEYLYSHLIADTIILHILLGNNIALDVFTRVVEKSMQCGNKIIILEHNSKSLDWDEPLKIPTKIVILRIVRLLAKKYDKKIINEGNIAGISDEKRNFFVLLQ